MQKNSPTPPGVPSLEAGRGCTRHRHAGSRVRWVPGEEDVHAEPWELRGGWKSGCGESWARTDSRGPQLRPEQGVRTLGRRQYLQNLVQGEA